MEYALWVYNKLSVSPCFSEVLILVLMEYALWGYLGALNSSLCLVLILVLMEYALWDGEELTGKTDKFRVLILVLMEYALWEGEKGCFKPPKTSLNPCFNGICSLRKHDKCRSGRKNSVLILVLMEYALWDIVIHDVEKVFDLS